VVVATRDRPRLLGRCLTALAKQTRPPDEVVVVDDGSGPATGAMLAGPRQQLPLTVRRRERSGGPGAARNDGWRATSAPLIAFTDDDCRPSAQWVEALLAEAAPRRVIVGRTIPDPDDGGEHSVFDRSMSVTAEDGRFSTCNVLYPRDLLAELGGFDPQFRRYGEDTDLGQRALAAGADAAFAPDALVWHAVHRGGVAAAVRDRIRFTEVARLLHRHPQVRSQICDGLFYRRAHGRLLLALLGASVLRVTPAGLVGASAWAGDAVHRVPLPAREPAGTLAKQLIGLALLDGVEVGACAWGGLRHRALIL
jgi:GT2 family glycosyltransferase